MYGVKNEDVTITLLFLPMAFYFKFKIFPMCETNDLAVWGSVVLEHVKNKLVKRCHHSVGHTGIIDIYNLLMIILNTYTY